MPDPALDAAVQSLRLRGELRVTFRVADDVRVNHRPELVLRNKVGALPVGDRPLVAPSARRHRLDSLVKILPPELALTCSQMVIFAYVAGPSYFFRQP